MAVLLLSLCVLLVTVAGAQAMNTTRVMTFNVLCRACTISSPYGRWVDRLPGIGDIFARSQADLLGIQEPISDEDVFDLQRYLPNHDALFFNSTFNDIDWNYPDAMLFYDRRLFAPLERGSYWLSETPDRPSIGWDRLSLPRIVTWAKFTDLRDGRPFVFTSTHFDNNGENKVPSATLFMERTEVWAQEGLPIIVTGDFNSQLPSDSYRILAEGTTPGGFRLYNTFDLVANPRFERNSDISEDYGCPQPASFPNCLIDHVFVAGPFNWRVSDWWVDVWQYKDESPYFPSDHRAYMAVVSY